MKKILLLQCFFLAAFLTATAQISIPFTIRYQNTVKGDMIVVGNTVLGTTKTGNFDNQNVSNGQVNQVYVDIDNDPTTFNSSSANVKDPNPGGACPRTVKKAFLYWAAVGLNNTAASKKVKFKVDNGNYQEITATNILTATDAYVYVADITDKLTNVEGTYTVANIQAPIGVSSGYAGGWTLFIVYEDTSKPARNITLFDGFEIIYQGNQPPINITMLR